MKSLIKGLGVLAYVYLAFAALSVFGILLTISLDVGLRVAINEPLGSALEVVSYYFMVPVAFLPLMILELENGHVSTDIFYNHFPRVLQNGSQIVGSLLTTIIYVLVAYVTFDQAVTATKSGEVSMGVSLLPIWPVRWVLPVAFGMAAIASIASTIKTIVAGGSHD